MKLKPLKGMRDLFAEDISRFQFLEKNARYLFPLYGFSEIQTPLLEKTELFVHGVGQDTDIIGKEMYLLNSKRGESLALRPEGTASIVRHVIHQNLLHHEKTAKYFYIGPMFRYENPQKGRYRQFHQIGVETYGIETPDADLEMFLLLQHYFESIALSEVSFQLNSIGCNKEECRPTYKKLLLHYLQDISASLCSECLRRKDVNPLRVLDCKTCHSLTQEIPIIYKHLCNNCETHFSELQEMLQFHKIPYQLNPRLVRGLDYYSKTVFEVYSGNLGSQSAAGGGGRYDDLFQIYGAKKTPAIGFALGMDRLAMLIETPSKSPIDIFVIGDQRKEILKMVSLCRKSGYSTLYDPFQSSMKSQFRQANRVNAKKVIILGEEEIKHHQITLKDMENGTQIKLDEHKLSKHLSSFI